MNDLRAVMGGGAPDSNKDIERDPDVQSRVPNEPPSATPNVWHDSKPAPDADRAPEPEKAVPDPEDPAAIESACVIDGSKLILRIASADKPFQVDHGVKILFSSGPLKRVERTLLFNTYVVENARTTVVIDAGGNGYRFVPLLPAANDGVLYTRDGSFHVVLSGSGVLQRTRVSAPSLPTRVVNKFVGQSNFKLNPGKDLGKAEDVLFPWSNLGVQTGEGGVIFVRTDESVFEHTLLENMRSELHEGRPIAWTGNVNFASTGGWFCFKRLNQVSGSGKLWLDNGKPANNPNVVIT